MFLASCSSASSASDSSTNSATSPTILRRSLWSPGTSLVALSCVMLASSLVKSRMSSATCFSPSRTASTPSTASPAAPCRGPTPLSLSPAPEPSALCISADAESSGGPDAVTFEKVLGPGEDCVRLNSTSPPTSTLP